MPEVRQTAIFARWFTGLGDRRARARIQVRIDRLAIGNPEFATVLKVMRALGLKLKVAA